MFYDHFSARSWLNWVDEDDDEDEVGLKEKPEDASSQDTSFITSQTFKGCKQCIITRHFIYYITHF